MTHKQQTLEKAKDLRVKTLLNIKDPVYGLENMLALMQVDELLSTTYDQAREEAFQEMYISAEKHRNGHSHPMWNKAMTRIKGEIEKLSASPKEELLKPGQKMDVDKVIGLAEKAGEVIREAEKRDNKNKCPCGNTLYKGETHDIEGVDYCSEECITSDNQ